MPCRLLEEKSAFVCDGESGCCASPEAIRPCHAGSVEAPVSCAVAVAARWSRLAARMPALLPPLLLLPLLLLLSATDPSRDAPVWVAMPCVSKCGVLASKLLVLTQASRNNTARGRLSSPSPCPACTPSSTWWRYRAWESKSERTGPMSSPWQFVLLLLLLPPLLPPLT